MRIIIYSQHIRTISGVNTFERNFINAMVKYHEIEYVYKTAIPENLNLINKRATCTQDNGQHFECDLCIYSSLRHGLPEPDIKAKKYVQIVHLDIEEWKQAYRKDPRIDLYVTPKQSIADSLLKMHKIEAKVLPNILPEKFEGRKALRLMTASRIAEGKGFDRIPIMAKKLQDAGIPFIWEIYGDGAATFVNKFDAETAGMPVVLMGTKYNIADYMLANDYIVQLSDSESFCYSIYEGLRLQVPAIVTAWDGVTKLVQNGKNGYIFDMELSNFDANLIFNQIPTCDKLEVNDDTAFHWYILLNSIEHESQNNS